MLPILFRSTDRNLKSRPSRARTLAITLLLLYFLLFSIFALFHAYAANELDGAHGCNIGQWIHLGLQAAVFFLLMAGAAPAFGIAGSAPLPFVKTLLWSDHFKRGPPLLPVLVR
jgi:hypothetical protein